MKEPIKAYHNFFPTKILDSLIKYLRASNVRKHTFHFDESDQTPSPDCIINAAKFAGEKLGLRFNTAILKWYRVGDATESQAYSEHQDPANLTSIPLVLCSLTGQADMIYKHNSSHILHCVPNMVAVVDPHLIHRVTPPQNADGERFFLFLGYDTDAVA
jgi:hypothetical protein